MNKDNNLDVNSLRIFLEAAKDCNMTRAAESLGISQPAVSAAIKKIENSLNSPMFDRDRRPLQLTTAGRLLFNRAFMILEQLDDLTRSVQNSLYGKNPDVRLGFSDCMSACLCPLILGNLLDITENISARTGSTPLISNLLKHKNIDIALSSDPMEDVEGTRAFHFLTERFLFVLPKSVTQKRKILCSQDLISAVQDLQYLRFGKETFDFVQSERIYRFLHFMDSRRVEVDTNLAMMSLISMGKGWCILPPLSLWMGREFLDGVDFLALNNEAVRRYFVLFNEPSFETIARDVCKLACKTVKGQLLPAMEKERPDLIRHISLHDILSD